MQNQVQRTRDNSRVPSALHLNSHPSDWHDGQMCEWVLPVLIFSTLVPQVGHSGARTHGLAARSRACTTPWPEVELALLGLPPLAFECPLHTRET